MEETNFNINTIKYNTVEAALRLLIGEEINGRCPFENQLH
jgi:hypothetical protein